METIGNILRAIKTIRRDININNRKDTNGNQELMEKYRQEVILAEELLRQGDRLKTYASVLIGTATASQETVLEWIEQERNQNAPVSIQSELPF